MGVEEETPASPISCAYRHLLEASGNDRVAAMYDICIERVGKAVHFLRGTAEQKITIAPAQVEVPCRENNKILFGLIDALPRLRRDIKWRLPDQCVSESAFVDELDMKWRRPVATLWHVGRYISAIVELAPQYRLASTNYYYFARMLFHVVGLRHYSFHRIVSEDPNALKTRSPAHDPSSIAKLFWFLRREENCNGHRLKYHVNQWGIVFILAGAAVIALGGHWGSWRLRTLIPLLAVEMVFTVGFLWWFVCFPTVSLLSSRLQSQTENLVTVLGESLFASSRFKFTVVHPSMKHTFCKIYEKLTMACGALPLLINSCRIRKYVR